MFRNTKPQFAYFIVSTAFLLFLTAFAWGFLAGKAKIFPHDFIGEMINSGLALKDLVILEGAPAARNRSANEIMAPASRGGVTINELSSSYGSKYILMTLFKETEFRAEIIDREGRIVHTWRIPDTQPDMSKAADTGISLSKKNWMIHGACPRENGDIYIVIEYRGLLKLNKNSDPIWTIRLPVHHAVTADSDGSVWTLSRKKVKNRADWIPLATQPYWDDQVLHVSPDGEILEQFSILDIIFQNQYEGVLYGGHPGEPAINHDDPLHANDIDIMTKEQAVYFPGVHEGDIMVSMRTINTVFIFDRKTHDIRWCMTGPFHRQHDPEISRDGGLLVFDNRTAYGQRGGGVRYLTEPQALGYSRILEIDPVSRQILFQYQGEKNRPFYTSIQGKLAELPNRNILVVETEGGRVFEIDKTTKKIVWEFINSIDSGPRREGYVGRITQAIPIPEHRFSFFESDLKKRRNRGENENPSDKPSQLR